jgi:excisionase family DNA binding protein
MTTAPILVSKKTAAGLLSISIGMLEKLVRLRKLEPVRIGRKILFRLDDIQEMAMKESQRKALRNMCSGSVQ